MDKKIKPTPTESAFMKAKELDNVFGYIRETIGCTRFEPCSKKLIARYNIDPGSVCSVILGQLETLYSPKAPEQ